MFQLPILKINNCKFIENRKLIIENYYEQFNFYIPNRRSLL